MLTLMLGFLALVPAGCLRAQVQELVVSRSRLPGASSLSESVIESDSVYRTFSLDPAKLLIQVPGVYCLQPDSGGGRAELQLRGADPNFAVVLLDDVKLNDISNSRGGGYDLSTVHPDEIERIEVVRGAVSTVHGSDAMSGVVNIRSRRPAATMEARARAEFDPNGYFRVFGSASGPVAPATRAGLKLGYTDYDRSESGARGELLTFQLDADVTASPTTALWSSLRFSSQARQGFPDGSGGTLYAASRDMESHDVEETLARFKLQTVINEHWMLDAIGGFYEREDRGNTPSVAAGMFDGIPASSGTAQFSRYQLTISNQLKLASSLALAAGVDLQHESGRRSETITFGSLELDTGFELERTTRAIYAEASYEPSSSSQIHVATRAEADEVQSRYVGGVSIRRSVMDHWLIHASVANGYKRPSFYSLGDSIVGNPSLRSESSVSTEFGLERQGLNGRVVLSAAVFSAKYSELIDFDFNSFRLINRSEVEIKGAEISVRVRPLRALLVSMNFTASSIDPQDGGDALLYRPERYGFVGLDWELSSAWALYASAPFVGRRYGSSVPTGTVVLPSSSVVDLVLSRRQTPRTSWFVAIDNLFDAAYEQTPGFPANGARARFGVVQTF